MNIVSAIVLYAVIWFMTLFVVLPLRLKTQGDTGDVVPGTHASAPADPQLGKRAIIVTIAATIIWAIIAGIIVSGWITVEDLDVNGFMSSSEDDS